MKMVRSKIKNLILYIITPLIVLFVCVGILLIGMIKPMDKAKVYINLAFMDDLKIDPDSSDSGLVIKDNDIISGYDGETYETGEFIRPKYGELYGMIRTEKFDLDVPVYWGSDIKLFERGACQSTGSVIVGSSGNSVISAHEDTYFAELSNLSEGDTITINTNYGEFIYTVRETIEFNKKENKYVVPTNDPRLTLYTCKKNIFGSSDERIGVICDLTEKKFYTAGSEGQ